MADVGTARWNPSESAASCHVAEASPSPYMSRAAAEAWFNDEWWGWIEERFGARPTLTYFDHYVTVDNAAGEIRVDGVATAIAAE